jgi:hypothetical protein
METKKPVINEKEVVFIIILYSAYLFLPIVSQVTRGIGNLGIIILFFLFLFTTKGKIIFPILNTCPPLLIFFLMELTFSYLFGFQTMKSTLVFYMNIFAVYFMSYLIPYLNLSNKIKVLQWTLIFNIITSVITLYYLNIDPEYSRMLMHAGEHDAVLRSGAGGFYFIYCSLLITVTFVLLFIKLNGIWKHISGIGLIITLLLILKSSFTAALLICIIVLGLLLYYSFHTKIIVKATIIPLVIILILFLYLYGVDLLNFLTDIVPTGSAKVRMNEISNALVKHTIDRNTDLYSRLRTYFTSLKTFMKYPLGGILFSPERRTYAYALRGGHSNILDNLASYGILSFFYVMIFFNLYKLAMVPKNLKKYWNVAWIAFIMIAFINPINVSMMMFYLGIILPITVSAVSKESKGVN